MLYQAQLNRKGHSIREEYGGDAANLPEIKNHYYDAVLVFGPLYHLPREDRQKVIQESKRICKTGGIILFAYINKVGAYLRACIDENLKSRYPNKKANESVLKQGVDDILPDVFFFTMPEEMESDVTENGLAVVNNAGVDFAFNASNHAVLVCRK